MIINIIKLNLKFNYENIFEIEYDENLTTDLIKNKFCEKNEIENSFIIYNGNIFHENTNVKEIKNFQQEKYLILFIYNSNQNNINKSKYDFFNLLVNTYNRYYGIQNSLINLLNSENEDNLLNRNNLENEENEDNVQNRNNLENEENEENLLNRNNLENEENEENEDNVQNRNNLENEENEENLLNRNNLENEENEDNVDNTKNGDNLENEDNLKNDDNLKNGNNSENRDNKENLQNIENSENRNIENPINDLSENIAEQTIDVLNSFINNISLNSFGVFSLIDNPYLEQIKYLESLGFVDKDLNYEALLLNNGDIEGSINYLIDQNSY